MTDRVRIRMRKGSRSSENSLPIAHLQIKKASSVDSLPTFQCTAGYVSAGENMFSGSGSKHGLSKQRVCLVAHRLLRAVEAYQKQISTCSRLLRHIIYKMHRCHLVHLS